MTKEIIVIGDTHGEFGSLNMFLNKNNPPIILSVGDFGYWPRWSVRKWFPESRKPKEIPVVKSKETKIYFCDGNHEDHWSLKKLENNEIFPNTFYMKRGSTLTLPDGRNVLFMGGAFSYDKESRELGVDWFPEESITTKEIEAIDFSKKIDIVISHTAPKEFKIEEIARKRHGRNTLKETDGSRDFLSYILKRLNPPLWYFGHWHVYATGFDLGCRWTCLDHIISGYNWWEELR